VPCIKRNPRLCGDLWRGERRDSNPRPPGPQPGALPAELRSPRATQCTGSGARQIEAGALLDAPAESDPRPSDRDVPQQQRGEILREPCRRRTSRPQQGSMPCTSEEMSMGCSPAWTRTSSSTFPTGCPMKAFSAAVSHTGPSWRGHSMSGLSFASGWRSCSTPGPPSSPSSARLLSARGAGSKSRSALSYVVVAAAKGLHAVADRAGQELPAQPPAERKPQEGHPQPAGDFRESQAKPLIRRSTGAGSNGGTADLATFSSGIAYPESPAASRASSTST
jgi:hypothetical protein